MNEVIILPKVSFIDALLNGIKNYVNFQERVRRSEFWIFFLFISILEIVLLIWMFLTKKERIHNDGKTYYSFSPAAMVIFLIYELFIFSPKISSIVRRLHDCGKSGFFIFIFYIPIVGPFILLFYLCSDSQKEENKYGPSPKYFFCEKINDPLNQKNQYDPINQEDIVLPQENPIDSHEENDDDHTKLVE